MTLSSETQDQVKDGLLAFLNAMPAEGTEGRVHFSPQYKRQWSNSLGVGRKQRPRYLEHLKSHGLGHTAVDEMGRPEIGSERHRRAVCKSQHHIGMDSYYD